MLYFSLQKHRIVNIIDNSSSEDDIQQATLDIQMHRKKSRKRRKNNLPLTRLAHEIVEAIWDGGEEDSQSDDADEADGEILNDSDDCSDPGQVVPAAVLKHLHGEGPFIRAIAETHISELLSGAENDGSYSSPMSNKSEKNLADFDDEDVSPCEEELAELVSSHSRATHNCVPPGFAAAAAAMAAAHSAITMQNVESVSAALSAKGAMSGNLSSSGTPAESDVDIADVSNKESSKQISPGVAQVQQPTFKINDVCLPGNTLLWDLLQDDKIVSS